MARSASHYHILLNRLINLVGLSDAVLNWYFFYITEKCFVSLDTCLPSTHGIRSGVPQGSIFGPVPFTLDMPPSGDVSWRHGISFHSYADDTQLYIVMSPDDMRLIDTLLSCILAIKSWMASNFLQLIQDKKQRFNSLVLKARERNLYQRQ